MRLKFSEFSGGALTEGIVSSISVHTGAEIDSRRTGRRERWKVRRVCQPSEAGHWKGPAFLMFTG